LVSACGVAHNVGCELFHEENEMSQTLKMLTEKYGKRLKDSGISNEEAARFLQQIAKMMLHP